jgi:hypothetical protein
VAHLAVPAYAEGCYVYLLGDGGTVRCEGAPSGGACFVVMLPRKAGGGA